MVTSIDQTAGSTSNEQIVLRFQSMEMETELTSARAPAPGTPPGFNLSMNISSLVSASFAVSSLNDGASGGQLHDLMINKLLDAAVVVGDTQQGSASSQTEQVRLRLSRIEIEYRSTARGPIKAGYDVKANKAV